MVRKNIPETVTSQCDSRDRKGTELPTTALRAKAIVTVEGGLVKRQPTAYLTPERLTIPPLTEMPVVPTHWLHIQEVDGNPSPFVWTREGVPVPPPPTLKREPR